VTLVVASGKRRGKPETATVCWWLGWVTVHRVGARTWTTGGAAARHEIWRELSSLQPETAAVPCNPEQGGMLAR
jgi:hypothetical protein